MNTCRTLWTALIIGVGSSQPAVGQAPKESLVPNDSVIRQILVERIDKYHQSVGIVVGVIEPKGRRIVSHGVRDQGNPKPLNGDTVFEIGSITKVVTSLALADMAQRGELMLSDTVAKHLPPEAKVPRRGDREIVLLDLATHTSGLPRDPANINPKDLANPAADYSVKELYTFLSNYSLTRDIGSRYEYSNLGTSVLGQALAHRAGMDFGAVVESRVLKPLGMTSTGLSINRAMRERLAAGHSYMLERLTNWDMNALAPSGGLKSTANDMLKLLGVFLGYNETPLARAAATTLSIRRPTGHPDGESALGWDVLKLEPGYEFIHKSGATGGYRSFVAIDRSTRSGVVVLSNAATTGNLVVNIGMHLLNPEIPLDDARSYVVPRRRVAVQVDAKAPAGYVGRYSLPRGKTVTITLEGDQLFEQRDGELKVPIYPESQVDYFCRLFDEQVRFQIDSKGRTTAITYVQGGVSRQAKRVP